LIYVKVRLRQSARLDQFEQRQRWYRPNTQFRVVGGVIAAAGNEAVLATKAATATIPIVFALGDDPVNLGLVDSFNRPGGNITGVSFQSTDLVAKRLSLLRELIPRVETIGYLMNLNNAGSDLEMRKAQAAANSLSQQILVVQAGSEPEIDAAFEELHQQRVDAVVIGSGAFFLGHRDRLAVSRRAASFVTGTVLRIAIAKLVFIQGRQTGRSSGHAAN
jgi:putative ABC transport system substrate-binding protein